MSSTIFALSIHADYRCQHSGLCCSTDWDVPIELPIYRSLNEAVLSGRLRMAPDHNVTQPFAVDPDLPDEAAAIFERTDAGQCVFFERGSRLCIVHRDFGETALPSTCRHFPRVALRDARGTFITLSHFCPTAASMLFREDVDLRIVGSPPAFPSAEYEGLVVADDQLPPLLHPEMLMNLDGYAAWESHMIARCADPSQSPESVVATLRRDARHLRAWRPDAGPLTTAIAGLPQDFIDHAEHEHLGVSLELHADVMRAVPDEFRPAPDEDGLDPAFTAHVRPVWGRFRAPLNRFVAARAFACWTAYQGRGVASIVRGLEAALGVLRVEAARQCRDAGRLLDTDLLREAFRSTDFALNHLAVGEDLADGWSRAERDS